MKPPFSVRIATSDADVERCFDIRRRVFVEEQSVPVELEMDEFDGSAVHFLLVDGAGNAVGTARMLDRHGAAKIGRVAIVPEFRGRGLGLSIMEFVLNEARLRGYREAVLSSQTYAVPFYEKLGFVAEGPEYDDAGIPHRAMRKSL